jgi:hypothetical protein
MGSPPDLGEVDPNLIDSWLAAPPLLLDGSEEDERDSEAESAAVPQLENDPIRAEKFVIGITESLHRSEPPLMKNLADISLYRRVSLFHRTWLSAVLARTHGFVVLLDTAGSQGREG